MGVSRRHTLSMHLFLTLALATSLTLATSDPTVHVPLTYSQYPIAQYAQYPMAQYPSVRTMYHDCDDSLPTYHDCDDTLHDCEDHVAVLPHGVRYVVPKNVAPPGPQGRGHPPPNHWLHNDPPQQLRAVCELSGAESYLLGKVLPAQTVNDKVPSVTDVTGVTGITIILMLPILPMLLVISVLSKYLVLPVLPIALMLLMLPVLPE